MALARLEQEAQVARAQRPCDPPCVGSIADATARIRPWSRGRLAPPTAARQAREGSEARAIEVNHLERQRLCHTENRYIRIGAPRASSPRVGTPGEKETDYRLRYPWKPIFLWVPSQNGFLPDPPQRQR